MSDYNPRPLSELIDPGWAAALAPVEGRVHELGAMLAAEVDEGRGYLPAGTDVLRAFTYPFDSVKVLIVGQDPYPTPGHAMGLSFSVRPGVEIPKSLVNIFRELSEDVGCPPPSSGDLTPWSEQGVCLLNRVLTVRPGAAAGRRSHSARSTRWWLVGARTGRARPSSRSCGARTRSRWPRASGTRRLSRRRTPRRCPRIAVFSGRDHSRARTGCSRNRGRRASTGRWGAENGKGRRGRGRTRVRRPRRGEECREEGLGGYFSLRSNTPER